MEENKAELLGMHLDYQGGITLKETARWSKFLAIVGFAGLGVFVLAMLAAGSLLARYFRQLTGIENAGMGLALAFALIVLAIAVILVVLLYRFSALTRQGIETQDQVTFNNGLNSLRIYFMINGVLGVLSLISTIYSTFTAL
ncbi:MAG TPA: hypothetical protein VN616_12065 [Puia sp.]|nr:hypothetical protein [Puia sp.]